MQRENAKIKYSDNVYIMVVGGDFKLLLLLVVSRNLCSLRLELRLIRIAARFAKGNEMSNC